MAGCEVYFRERNNRTVMDAVGVREREDAREGVREATAHTSPNLEEEYGAGDKNEPTSGNCMVSKDRKRLSHSWNEKERKVCPD